jgi:hypothetical protein
VQNGARAQNQQPQRPQQPLSEDASNASSSRAGGGWMSRFHLHGLNGLDEPSNHA